MRETLVKPTPESAVVPPVWETAGNCPACGAPIYSRRDPARPDAPPEVRRNCPGTCVNGTWKPQAPAPPAQPGPSPTPKRGHVQDVCRCGAVILSCRCIGPHEKRVVCESCASCRGGKPGGGRDADGFDGDCG